MTKFLCLYTAFVISIISVKFHHDTDKGTRGQKPFLYSDKCHNSVINFGNLPINNPKRDIVGTNAYAKLNEIRL